MANRERGEVALEAGGKTYTLRFTTNAICDLEDALDMSIVRIAARVGDVDGFDFRTLRVLLRAGLAGGGAEMDLKAVGKILDDGDKLEILQVLGGAFMLAFPRQEKQEADGVGANPLKTPAGNGRKSDASGSEPGVATANSGD